MAQCTTCELEAQVKDPTAPEKKRYWPWCFDHLIEESKKADKRRRTEGRSTCISEDCDWPPLIGDLCHRCIREETEVLVKADIERRNKEEEVK